MLLSEFKATAGASLVAGGSSIETVVSVANGPTGGLRSE